MHDVALFRRLSIIKFPVADLQQYQHLEGRDGDSLRNVGFFSAFNHLTLLVARKNFMGNRDEFEPATISNVRRGRNCVNCSA
jgi:hypothetical protein